MQFDESYFEKEVREGHEVSSLMKRVWAAQLELLEDIRKVCEKHDIKFCAEYGTLLGAVRHKGYIPWDDDLDIGMLRADLNKFLSVAEDELPKSCLILNAHKEKEYRDLMTRVVNTDSVTLEAEHMKKYHGCPFVIGIDIFPLDYVPRNDEEITAIMTILKALEEIMKIIWGEVDVQVKIEAAKQAEVLTGVSLDWKKPIDRQILNIYEGLTTMYTDEESDKIGIYARMVGHNSKDYCAKKESYYTLVEMPFENTTIPVPIGYDEILSFRYGTDYMTPKIRYSHNYPFYKAQQGDIRKFVEKNPQYQEIWEPFLQEA